MKPPVLRLALLAVLATASSLPASAAPPAATPAPAAPVVDDDGPDLDEEVEWLARMMKKRRLGKKDPERIAERLDALGVDDLAWVHARLGEVPEEDRKDAAAEVLAMSEERLLGLRWGRGVLALPEAWTRLQATAPDDQVRLLADLVRLEDMEPATRFALWALDGSGLPVRLRAVDALADALTFGGDAARILPALEKALDDPSPAVRDVAVERLVDASHPAVLDWCLAHLEDDAAEEAEIRGEARTARPADRAWVLLTELSRKHQALEPADFRALPDAERAAIREELRAWRRAAGGNPLRDRGDGPFDPLPLVTTAWVDRREPTVAHVRWWSEVDRAQFRLDLDELDVVASTRLDWNATFRVYVIASGARNGSWEAYVRRLPCGQRHRLGRRGFALVETAIQLLLDGRIRVWVRSHEARGGR